MSTAGDTTGGNGKTREAINEPSEADRALTVVKKKLSKTLSVTATVNDLINQASDDRNLAVLYAGMVEPQTPHMRQLIWSRMGSICLSRLGDSKRFAHIHKTLVFEGVKFV